MVARSGLVKIRPYEATDASATLDVFLAAVTITASSDYSPEQVVAWSAPQERELHEWNRARVRLQTIVATVDGHIAGLSDVSAKGYIDMMFVAPQFGRRGVASALLREIERRAAVADTTTLSADASITARPFFEGHGFSVVAEQHPITRGVRMTNYRMVKQLSAFPVR